jgi:hypothetical protein
MKGAPTSAPILLTLSNTGMRGSSKTKKPYRYGKEQTGKRARYPQIGNSSKTSQIMLK